jgi:hypothetical protein
MASARFAEGEWSMLTNFNSAFGESRFLLHAAKKLSCLLRAANTLTSTTVAGTWE